MGYRDTVDDPHLVVRTGGEHDEAFTTRLRWEKTDLLNRTDSGHGYFEAVPITAKEAERFEALQAKRVEDEARNWKNRAYYAIVGRSDTVEHPHVVVRRGGEHDEVFTARLRWEWTDLPYRIDSGREYYDLVPISAEEGKRFEQTQARRVAEIRERDGS
ncbi:hypothetical protein [Lentzea sp. NPDC055074]